MRGWAEGTGATWDPAVDVTVAVAGELNGADAASDVDTTGTGTTELDVTTADVTGMDGC